MSNEVVPTEVAPVRAGEDLDWPTVEAYLREHVPDLEGDFEVRQFPNGAANLTYFLQFGDRPLVLRRPPFGRLAPGAHDMAREHRVCRAVWRAYPAAPAAEQGRPCPPPGKGRARWRMFHRVPTPSPASATILSR